MKYQLYYFPYRDVSANYYPYIIIIDGYVSKCYFDFPINIDGRVKERNYPSRYDASMDSWSRMSYGMDRDPQLLFESDTKQQMDEYLNNLIAIEELSK